MRYLRPTFPGTLTCGGEVAALVPGGAELTLWSRDEGGETTTAATVQVMRAAA